MKTYEPSVPHSSDDLRRLADQIEFFVRRFRELADQLDKYQISSVDVPATKTRDKGIVFLSGAMKHATSAVDSAIIRRQSRPTQAEESSVAEGMAAEAEARRKLQKRPSGSKPKRGT